MFWVIIFVVALAAFISAVTTFGILHISDRLRKEATDE